MKKIFIFVLAILVLIVAYWLISPLWRDVALNEALPGTVKDNLETMSVETKAEFEKQTLEMSGKVMLGSESMPAEGPQILANGKMVARAHEVSGSALFVKSGNEHFLRFENLKTINGPDLRIYLSADLGAEDYVDLGVIRATEGNVNYTIPPGTDLSKYKYAMIWCRAFGVLFSYAELNI